MKSLTLILSGVMMFYQTSLAQTTSPGSYVATGKNPLLTDLHTLSIHVRDTITHDSIFHFLVDKLKLPVYYNPVTYGKQKYAGVYAGNLVLEPCGPYSDFFYASQDFRAIFFGLTFEPSDSLSHVAAALAGRKILHECIGNEYIYLKDSAICGDNITVSFMNKNDNVSDRQRTDSLRYIITANNKNELGIEYVKEIWIGYKDSSSLEKWKKLILPSELKNRVIWMESNILEFHFVKSNIKEVQSITFKVKSLERAKQYLLKNNLSGRIFDNKLLLKGAQAFGLSIYLTEIE